MNRLDVLSEFFDCLTLSPAGWPVVIAAAAANKQTFAKWPEFPHAATVEKERMGHGRGLSPAQSKRSAVGELVEIASCCDWGDLKTESHTSLAVGQDGWSVEEISGFSGSQYETRESWNTRLKYLDWVPAAVDPSQKIDWIAADNAVSGRKVLVPADACVIGRSKAGNDTSICVADTNGCAAGPDLQTAKLSALLELIERDATGTWWYGGSPSSRLDVRDAPLAAGIHDVLHEQGRMLHVLEITNDLGVPSVAALATDQDGARILAGFGARLCVKDAVVCALTELMQMELKLFMSTKHHIPVPELAAFFDTVCLRDAPGSTGEIVSDKSLFSDAVAHKSINGHLSACLSKLSGRQCRVAFVDFSRPEFGVPVVKAISPDLCHWKPRLGRRRLLTDKTSGSNRKLLYV